MGTGRVEDMVAREDVDGLIASLTDTNMDTRREAAEALGNIGDKRAVEPLIAALNDTTNYPVIKVPLQVPSTPVDARGEAALALGKLGDRSAVDALQAVADADPPGQGNYRGLSVGEAANMALAKINDDDGLNEGAIIEALRKGTVTVRSENRQRTIELLIGALKNPSARDNALQSLIPVHTELQDSALRAKLADALKPLLKDNRSNNRLAAAKMLGEVGDFLSLGGLASQVGLDVDVQVQKACLESMWRIDGAEAIRIITDKIKDYDKSTEATSFYKTNWYGAADALGQIGEPWVVDPLILMLADEDFVGSPSLQAAEALGEIGDPRAIEPLIDSLKTDDAYTRRRSADALRAITGQDFGDDFHSWQQWRRRERAGEPPKGTANQVQASAPVGPEEQMSSKQLLLSFNGRIGRRTFWLKGVSMQILLMLIIFTAGIIAVQDYSPDWLIGLMAAIMFTGAVLLFWISLAVSVKRWHDRDKSGWWMLITLIPYVGHIWAAIELGFFPGSAGANPYGKHSF